MKTPFTIRQAMQSDWRAVKSLLEENNLPLAGALEHLNSYMVAIDNGQVIGCAGTEVYGDIALMRSISVAPLMKHAGVGKALVLRILQEARQKGLSRIFLLTVTAPEYFTRFGFQFAPIENAPQALKNSAEFNGACPTSATLMSLAVAS